MLTDDEYQQLIAGETGAVDYSSDFNTLFPLWWKNYSYKPANLRYLWTKLRTLQFLMGKYRARYDVVRGTDQSRMQQQFNNALLMAGQVTDELKMFDPEARGINKLQVGSMGSNMPDAIEIVARWDIPRLRLLNRIG